MGKKHLSRREFMGRAGTAAAAFTIVPRHVLGGPGRTAPSDVVTRGVIGTGGMGTGAHVTVNKEGQPPITLAVCDVDKKRMERALKKAGRGCDGYGDFRRVLERKDLDTIHIATPPHWHALISIAAVQAGKDVICEKPLTRFIAEGRILADAVERYGRVLQVGTYRRFGSWQGCGACKDLRKIIASGMLGKPVTVRLAKRMGFNWKTKQWSGKRHLTPQPVPSELDYDMWLGPAPVKPYHRHRTHGSFRGYWDYDGGGLSDMGQHFLDPVQYFLGKDGTSPVKVEALAPWPAHPDACGMWGRVTLTYADGGRIILESGEWGEQEPGDHAPIEGPNGKIWRYGKTDPAGLFEASRRLPDPPRLVSFHTALRTREQPGGNAAVAHRSAALLHLANIAIRTGRPLHYDPVAEQFVGDEEANRFVSIPMRAPWRL